MSCTRRWPTPSKRRGADRDDEPDARRHPEAHLVRRLGAHVDAADSSGLDPDQVEDLLATLYGLYAVLRLHFVQEEESYFTLAGREPERTRDD